MGAVDRRRHPRGSRRAARGRGDPGRPADQPHGGDHHGPPGALDVAATPGAVWVTNSGSGATAWRGSTRRPTGSPTARVRPGWATGTTTPCPGSTQRRTGSLVADPDRVPRRQPGGRHWRRLGHQRRPREWRARGRGGCAHRPADQPSGRDDRRRWSPDRCRGNQGRRLGVGRRPRHGATDRRALTRLPDLVAFRSQAATMSWVVRMGRQEWAGCKCGRRDRLQPIRGYERNVWPPRRRPRRSINRAKRTTQRGRSIPLRGHMASHSRLPLSPECLSSRLRHRRYPTRLVEPRLSAFA